MKPPTTIAASSRWSCRTSGAAAYGVRVWP
jgi:hypothetical protein